MKRFTIRTVAARLAPFLLTLFFSLMLSTYMNRQAVFSRAAYEGDITRMKIMYALGADPNEAACPSRACLTPLVNAGWGGHPEAIRFVLDRGAAVNKRGKFDATALMMAAYCGHDESVELLLSRGADLNTKDRYLNTALSYAKQRNHRTTVDLLKRFGALEEPN